MAGPDLTPEMEALQADMRAGFEEASGFFYPYQFPTFSANVWPADVRGGNYARAVAAVPELASADVRFMTVRPSDTPPRTGTVLPFKGGKLTVRHWGMVDPLSGEAIGACTWTP